MNRHLHIRRCFPDPFTLDFLPLFAMSDMVMENARHPQTIRLSSICVEDNTTVLEVLLCQGLHSTFLIAPGPGALLGDILGCNLWSNSVSGRPRWTIPDHCSQITGLLLSSARSFRSVLLKVASSASLSAQVLPLPNTISFSFSSTQAFRSCIKRFSMSSMTLWLVCKMR